MKFYHWVRPSSMWILMGEASVWFETPKQFVDFFVAQSPLLRTIKSAFAGNVGSQEVLKYAFHQAGRQTLQDISDGASGASLAFLTVGLPQGSAVAGGISLTAEGILALDDFRQGNTKAGTVRLAAIFVGGIVKQSVRGASTVISKSIQVTVGKNNLFYSVGRQGALKTADALKMQLLKDITDGRFGQEIAPEIASQLISNAIKAFGDLENEN